MRILIYSPWTLPSVGGTQKLVDGLAGALHLIDGVDVTVLSGAYPEGMQGLVQHADECVSYQVVRLPLVEPGKQFRSQHLLCDLSGPVLKGADSLVASLRPDFLLYTPHACNFAVQALVAARASGARFLLWPAIHLDRPGQTSTAAIGLYECADAIIANSNVEATWLSRAAHIPTDRIYTFGGGYHANSCEAIASARQEHPRSGRPLRALSIGQIRPHKRFGDQIRALSALKTQHDIDVSLVIAGASFGHTADLRSLAAQLHLTSSVHWREDCTEAVLLELLRAADIFFFTSESESFGIAVIEAIAAGVFPVVYPGQPYSELVRDSGFGLVAKSMDPCALADEVAHAVRRPDKLSAEPCTRHWLKDRTWNAIASGLLSRPLLVGSLGQPPIGGAVLASDSREDSRG